MRVGDYRILYFADKQRDRLSLASLHTDGMSIESSTRLPSESLCGTFHQSRAGGSERSSISTPRTHWIDPLSAIYRTLLAGPCRTRATRRFQGVAGRAPWPAKLTSPAARHLRPTPVSSAAPPPARRRGRGRAEPGLSRCQGHFEGRLGRRYRSQSRHRGWRPSA